jgi:hypothetical protein
MRLPFRLRVTEILSDGGVWGVWIGTMTFYVAVVVTDALTPKERTTLPTGALLLLTVVLATLDLPVVRNASSLWDRGIVGAGFAAFALPLWAWTQVAPSWYAVVRTAGVAFLSALVWGATATRFRRAAWLTVLAPCLVVAPNFDALTVLSPFSVLRASEDNRNLILCVVLSFVVVVLWRRYHRSGDFPFD